MISLSPLTTVHPCVFHHTRVRPSTQCYLSFSLTVVRSPGFGSTTTNSFALFRLGFPPAPALPCLNLARYRNSQAHSTKGTPSEGYPSSDLLWAYGFRFSFTPLTGVLFAFPSRYYSAIGRRIVFSLGSWSTQLPTRFLEPRRTQVAVPRSVLSFKIRGSHPLWPAFPCRSPTTHPSDFARSCTSLRTTPPTPHWQRRAPYTSMGLGSSPFARRY